MPSSKTFETMLSQGRDTALLRYSLGNAYLQEDEPLRAAEQFEKALAHDPHYSAAWKLYGRALSASGAIEAAQKAYQQGIAVAEQKGDIQAAKEMRVFLRRLTGTTSD